ncbi:hypothetical protein [Streptomyces beijiangensis]|uniref:Uncharacterized protein n=1 Tax=Streptomyces beijiangensis TaxID=163361 RepID=A0A939JKS2_9ACTN|nr:hypothetical protein [Streptomyces beijiangensis]MBO0515600.1 hypothetical protein [Streptomyces beijiangensis]
MNSKRARQVTEAATAQLVPGERIQFTGLAKAGSVSVKRRALTTALVGVLSAGTLIAVVQPRPMYMALTDQRLMFFDATTSATGKPGKLLMSLPRQLLSVEPLSGALLGLGLKTVLSIQGEEQGLKLTFPPAYKRDGRALAARLPVTV